MHLAVGMMHESHIQFTINFSKTPWMVSISLQTQNFHGEWQTSMVALLPLWKLDKRLQACKTRLRRKLCSTMKLPCINSQLSGACGQFRAHLADFNFFFWSTMISNKLICWKSVSGFIICTQEELGKIKSNLSTCQNGGKHQRKMKHGITPRICCLRTSRSMIRSNNFVITLNMNDKGCK